MINSSREIQQIVNVSTPIDSKSRASEEKLDLERYADLKEDEEDETPNCKSRTNPSRLHFFKLFSSLVFPGGGNSAYSQVPFDYGASKSEVADTSAPENDYEVPANLNPPVGLNLPSSMKDHHIIEKTAIFLQEKGPQMEIILKIKQANNSSFNFLNIDDPLNQYYRYLQSVIRSGKYKPNSVEITRKDIKSPKSSDESDDEGYYLHPSLFKSQPPKVIAKLPLIPSSESNSYSKLAESLKESIPCDNNKDSPSSLESKVSGETKSILPAPPSEISVMIDKLAERVAKNGDAFELSVKKRNDSRFAFLVPGNVYHAHYINRKLHFIEQERKIAASLITTAATKTPTSSSKGICFSIASKLKNSDTDRKILDSNVKEENNKDEDALKDIDLLLEMTECEMKNKSQETSTQSSLADKLASANRDLLSREKQVQQAERRQRAALFVSLLKAKQDDKDPRTIDPSADSSASRVIKSQERDHRDHRKSDKSRPSPSRSRGHVRSISRSRSKSPVRRNKLHRKRSRSRSRSRSRRKSRSRSRSRTRHSSRNRDKERPRDKRRDTSRERDKAKDKHKTRHEDSHGRKSRDEDADRHHRTHRHSKSSRHS